MGNLSKALELIDNNFKLIPLHTPTPNGQCSCGQRCDSQGKHPRIRNWTEKASNDPGQIREWWQKWPEANIGIVCGRLSNIVVLDMDPRHKGEESLEALEQELGVFTQTTTIMTGGGGKHFYYLYPGENKIRNSSGKLGEGLDVKTDGGYVVAPGSLHKSGSKYDFLFGLEEIKPFPDKLVKRLRNHRKTENKPDLSSSDPIWEGKRNDTLFSIGVELRKRGANRIQIESELIDINRLRCNPPLENSEIKSIANSASKGPGSVNGNFMKNAENEEYGLWDTEFGNANEFVERFTEEVRYNIDGKHWLVWDGARWKKDPNELIVSGYAKKLIEKMYEEASKIKDTELRDKKIQHIKKSAKGTGINAILTIARTDLRIRITENQLDQRLMMITLENLTYDLDSGKKLKHNPNHFITKKLPFSFDSKARGQRWREFVLQIMNGDEEMASFLQEAVGYSLTGLTSEQCLFFLYGQGKNGKTTFVEVLMKLFDEYACKAENRMIMDVGNSSAIPNDVARLNGHRFVLFSEIQEGRRLDEAKVKNLTGGDTITARFLRQEFFDFEPSHTIWLFGNHKPLISGTDDGIWRRLRLIKFARQFSEKERDRHLREKLYKELPGIFNWALEGLEKWKGNGRRLAIPEKVKRETLNYRGEMDVLTSFIQETCKEGVTYSCSNKELRSAYELWCSENGLQVMSNKTINPKLEQKGFKKYYSNGRVHWKGITPVLGNEVEEVEDVEEKSDYQLKI
ncbi:MAG: bifunctional DNA primase/polymerase [Gracilimonas sp.]|uniref:phage/plasmid primase, P4 family n=1 Tax=Gracilimonas sp. TaxID=1974203 RepID=UPI001B0317B9|nr:phage/plasmid primase, P4 family [Gracilimonas sp.]MBO6584755.1 bifunctional DNA primase/polymerase [Gracilimonas sp.]MBO6615974.1 bifunctional DNA primase/polymerase [Gracilimonas sp.]